MNSFKFKENAKAEIGTEDPFYALSNGGYLKPESVLEDREQAKAVSDAVQLIQNFIDACYEFEVIEEM